MGNIEEIKSVVKKPWLTVSDMKVIYPCGRTMLYEMFRNAKVKAIDENYYIPVCKPPVVPTEIVLKLYPVGKKKSS